jgi:hypothetical protein
MASCRWEGACLTATQLAELVKKTSASRQDNPTEITVVLLK